MEWKIKEQTLKTAADKSTSVESKRYKTSIPGVKYYLDIHPNGNKEEHGGQAWLFLQVTFNGMKIKADWTISIKSASYKQSKTKKYENSKGYGSKICSRDELFRPDKKFMIDGKMTIELKGTLKAVDLKRKSTAEICTLGQMLSERRDMDFVITVGSEVVKVSLRFFPYLFII